MNATAAAVMALSADPSAGAAVIEADVARAARGDSFAFERLYRAHVPRVHSLVRRMLGSGDADEVTQDVFVRTWQKLGTFRGDAAFATWLHRLAVNVVLERRRNYAIARGRIADDAEAIERATVAPAMSNFRVDFESAIERLPAGAREIFVLHDVEGYKHREIAAMLEIAPGTSKRQLHRARLLMRAHLAGDEWR